MNCTKLVSLIFLTENYNRAIRYLFTNLITYLIFNIVVAEQKLLLPMIPFSRPLVLQSVPKLKKCQKPLVYHLLLTEDLVPLLLFWNTCCYAFMLGEMIMMDLTLRILMCLKDSWNHLYQNLSLTEKRKNSWKIKLATKIFLNDLNFHNHIAKIDELASILQFLHMAKCFT